MDDKGATQELSEFPDNEPKEKHIVERNMILQGCIFRFANLYDKFVLGEAFNDYESALIKRVTSLAHNEIQIQSFTYTENAAKLLTLVALELLASLSKNYEYLEFAKSHRFTSLTVNNDTLAQHTLINPGTAQYILQKIMLNLIHTQSQDFDMSNFLQLKTNFDFVFNGVQTQNPEIAPEIMFDVQVVAAMTSQSPITVRFVPIQNERASQN